MSSEYFRMNTGGKSSVSMNGTGNLLGCCCSCVTFFCICFCCCACCLAGFITILLIGLYVNQIMVLGGFVTINRQDFQVAAFNVTTTPNKFYLVTKVNYGIKNTATKDLRITHAEIDIFYKEILVGKSSPRSERIVRANSELKPNLELDIEIENTDLPSNIIKDMKTELTTTRSLKLIFKGKLGVYYHYIGEIPILTYEESIKEK